MERLQGDARVAPSGMSVQGFLKELCGLKVERGQKQNRFVEVDNPG
jgi:hypothetical protein